MLGENEGFEGCEGVEGSRIRELILGFWGLGKKRGDMGAIKGIGVSGKRV